jgi:NADPH:quinone reductase-like Zn-dependent oxidoreductase
VIASANARLSSLEYVPSVQYTFHSGMCSPTLVADAAAHRLPELGACTLEPWIGPLSAALSEGIASPVVHAAVPFADAPAAHRILASRENVGKVVLVP